MYSIKMRANKDATHISGGETLCSKEQVDQELTALFKKGFQHSNGDADFLNIKVERVATTPVDIPCLHIVDHQVALETLASDHAISAKALETGLAYLHNNTIYRGAIILDKETGERLDNSGSKGIRVTTFGVSDDLKLELSMRYASFMSKRIKEALSLTSCINFSDQVAGELCISDDLNYTTGYFASKTHHYNRLHQVKPENTRVGGRIIFVDHDIDIERYIEFLSNTPKMVVSS
ncbi:6-carboxyhexanoate--CoA ligase [Staphylococcus massiliensis]|uniref:6-carboxyhexanoate--CoA ligase n=1 Tax=Staphylococcus massiliensis S46 TaxID=1229783 RepID=K9ALP8_9STAP|nr:6-carboxyhexanoate--CoA ligase [Staphylococcus massiliensis]EKU48229.1 6-carboxyhexanoate--CoA ligase [Staphylococcus massiliensis S46]MCG3399510.1 6-carboxyhexanoate--CoA ligase [Staphylococcus massiliensis]MCG3402019.1 6-carboxyhexanoate--CoA ligase [Staphylococcus massiliensis]MCG3412752.1 6-carboxyhexanoate--CoA ligase [Staphylococcus massiliensis]POA00119.1 6-carboxyhexanoate--CoA ligase [Staphylococcus massiliensis CCUG 55927]